MGPVPDVANDRSRFTSRESDCASDVTQVARRQVVDRHRIIRVEKSSSFEPILSQNSCDGYHSSYSDSLANSFCLDFVGGDALVPGLDRCHVCAEGEEGALIKD